MPTCEVCDDVITQPLCARCLEQQVATWLWEQMPEESNLFTTLSNLRDELCTLGGVTDCIKCGMAMSVCSFCYTEHVHRWVKKHYPHLEPEFRTLFYYGEYGMPVADMRRPIVQ